MTDVVLLKDFERLLDVSRDQLQNVFEKGDVIIKIHFGEPGNETALFPEDVAPIVEYFNSKGINVKFLDTPVAYDSERSTVEGYMQVVEDRGWNNLGECKISEDYVKVKTKDMDVEVCKDLAEADNVLVISHVKGHSCAGFGGAVKNLAMGGVSVKSKSDQHGMCKPKWKSECQGCETCVSLCPAGAIKMVDGKAEIDLDGCWGCSICQNECPYDCLEPEVANFDDLLGQAASAVISKLPKNTYYINIIKNVTKLCDCEVNSEEKIAKDLGVLFSSDPVAIDLASIDLIEKHEGTEVFKEVNHKDPRAQVEFAGKYSKSEGDFEIVEI